MPADRIERLSREFLAAARSEQVRNLCVAANLEPLGTTSQQALAALKADIAKFADTIKRSNIKFD